MPDAIAEASPEAGDSGWGGSVDAQSDAQGDGGGADGGAGCDASTTGSILGSGTASDPFRACAPLADCLAYREALGAAAQDGYYSIAPQGSAFTDLCNMSIVGGGWTLLTSQYTSALGAATRNYLYLYNGRWYESPSSTLIWSWSTGHQLAGTYTYFSPTSSGALSCAGSSSETPSYGIGCSNGGGVTAKVLMAPGGAGTNCSGTTCPQPNPAAGTGNVCQDSPDAFGVGTCGANAKIFARVASPTPSCAPGGSGMTNCGSGSESCCTSLELPAGTYYRTYTNTGSGPTGEAAPATVSGFRLDKYDVTVGRFRQFVTAWNNGSGWTPPAGSGKHAHLNGGQGLVNGGNDAGLTYETGWLTTDNGNIDPTTTNLTTSCLNPTYATWTASAGSNENLPIACVNWWEAYAFCIWDAGFLPSEAEWEYAAAGGSQQREYPWGTTAPGMANQYAIYGCYYPNGSGSCTGVANIAPVGTATLGAGLWGQLDLAGNMWQWNVDGYDATYVVPCTDCAFLTAASSRVLRGTGLGNPASNLLPPHRFGNIPSSRGGDYGFRCARVP